MVALAAPGMTLGAPGCRDIDPTVHTRPGGESKIAATKPGRRRTARGMSDRATLSHLDSMPSRAAHRLPSPGPPPHAASTCSTTSATAAAASARPTIGTAPACPAVPVTRSINRAWPAMAATGAVRARAASSRPPCSAWAST